MPFRYLAIGLFAVFVQSCAQAPKDGNVEPAGEVLAYGVYAYSGDKGRSWINPLSTSPVVWEGGDAVLVKQIDRVPLIKDIYFAFEYEFHGLPDGEISMDWAVRHPEITRPDGSISTGYTYAREFTVQNGRAGGVSGYILNQDYELVPGEWSLSYSYQGNVLVEKVFTLYRDSDD